jgi:hypothetical protein
MVQILKNTTNAQTYPFTISLRWQPWKTPSNLTSNAPPLSSTSEHDMTLISLFIYKHNLFNPPLNRTWIVRTQASEIEPILKATILLNLLVGLESNKLNGAIISLKILLEKIIHQDLKSHPHKSYFAWLLVSIVPYGFEWNARSVSI